MLDMIRRTFPAPCSRSGRRRTATPFLSLGGGVLAIRTAHLVLQRLRLRHAEGGLDWGRLLGGMAGQDVVTGPKVIDLSPNGPTLPPLRLAVREGTYDHMEFTVGPLEAGDPGTPAALAAHPELDGVSVRVTGLFNGFPFIYSSSLQAEASLALRPPLLAPLSGHLGLPLPIDPYDWFRSEDVEHLMNPVVAATGLGAPEVVEANIAASLVRMVRH